MRHARIMIVDDHPVVCDGLEVLLAREEDLRVECKAYDRKSALSICASYRPDLAIVDLVLGRDSGIELMPALKEIHPSIAVLGFSMHDDMGHAQEALAAGAHGYIAKGLAPAKISEAIREVLAGRVYVLVSGGTGAIERTERDLLPGWELLTEREREVLELIARGHTRAEIARQLGVSVHTVENHRANLRRKLGVSSSHELARLALLRSMAGK